MHHPPQPPGPGLVCPSPWAPSCVLQSCSAPGRIDTLAGASSLSQESGAPRVPARPQVVQEVDEAALTWATRRCWNLLFLRRRWEQRWRLLPLVEGREENLPFLFCSHFLKKEQFPFPPGSQVHGTTVCDALLPHSRPRPILPVAKRVRFRDDIPPHAPLASPVWDPGSSVRMPQNAPPSVPSTPTLFRCTTTGMLIVMLEPLAQRLEAWLTLPSLSRWLTRTIRLGYAIQFARRPLKFNAILETSVAVRNAPVLREEIAVLLAKDANRAGPSSQEEAGVLQPLLHRTQEMWWPSATQTVPTVCVWRSGMAVQGPPLRALPVSPCVHKGRRRRPYPVTGGGYQDPLLTSTIGLS